uniref:Uncharacterized protein n=1 Tax=viral metagenome TaxID=1070528 RepID=A0A6M3LDJ5_9ZZZZ
MKVTDFKKVKDDIDKMLSDVLDLAQRDAYDIDVNDNEIQVRSPVYINIPYTGEFEVFIEEGDLIFRLKHFTIHLTIHETCVHVTNFTQ